MRIGELRHRIKILELTVNESVYSWSEKADIWAKAEEQDKTNLFSKIGIGVKSVKFTVRKCDLTLHNAVWYKGNHYFLSDIAEFERRYYDVLAAKIEPKTCIATRKDKSINNLNRPIFTPQMIATFPACLIEKYLGYHQEKPQAVQELTYVLVTPKPIELKIADLVTIGKETYNVQIPHYLDEYKNEYEITLVKDV